MTNQELFDRVVKHLAKQGKRSFDGKEQRCRYRMKRGGRTLKCAIGCLIPKRRYSPTIEGVAAYALPLSLTGLRFDQADLAMRLQAAHDMADERYELVASLKHIASVLGLDDSAVDLVTTWQK